MLAHVVRVEEWFVEVRIGDGTADIYLDDDGMMANHISGVDPWDLLLVGAREADWVILPVGCPTCVTRPAQEAELPVELRDDVRLVHTGGDLLAIILET